MARPRTPAAVASVTGAAGKNPGRFEGRSSPKAGALGKPPKWLDDLEAEAWAEFAGDMPWLVRSDRTVVALASRLKARLMTDPEFGVNAMAQLRMCLSSMGGTPADRTKVSVPDEDTEDPADAFFN